jgi:hypothetical protein
LLNDVKPHGYVYYTIFSLFSLAYVSAYCAVGRPQAGQNNKALHKFADYSGNSGVAAWIMPYFLSLSGSQPKIN